MFSVTSCIINIYIYTHIHIYIYIFNAIIFSIPVYTHDLATPCHILIPNSKMKTDSISAPPPPTPTPIAPCTHDSYNIKIFSKFTMIGVHLLRYILDKI